MDCPSNVSQKVCVEAKVTVVPGAKVKDVHACCVGEPEIEECETKQCGCTYMVSQMMCVRFPLTISVSASAEPSGIVCCEPKVHPCSRDDDLVEEDMRCLKEASFLDAMPKVTHPYTLRSKKKCFRARRAFYAPPSHREASL